MAELQKNKKATNQVNEYATGKMGPLLLKFAIPAIIGMLCGGVQNIVNRIFVGRACGADALAGVQIGFPVTTLFMALSMLIGMGSMTLIAIRLGQQRKDDAEKILGQAIFLLFLIPLICTIVLMPFLDQVLTFIGASQDVLPYARDYFKIMMFAMIFFSMSVGLNNIIRAQGAPNIAMGTQILASGLNVFFNWLFVWVFDFGVTGAATGILLGNFISLFWIFGYFARKASFLSIRFKYIRLYPSALKAVLSLGIAPFLIQCASSIQQFIMNMSLVKYGGDAAITALSIVMACSSILLMPMMGFSQGAQPIMGYNYGAGNYERIKGTLYRAMLYGTIFGILSWLFIMFCSSSLVALFIEADSEVGQLAEHALKLFFCCTPFIPIGVCGGGLFQACGKVVRSMFLSLSRQFIFFIPCLIILPIWFGLDGCWIAGPVSDVAACFVTLVFVFFGLKSIKKELEEKRVGKLVE